MIKRDFVFCSVPFLSPPPHFFPWIYWILSDQFRCMVDRISEFYFQLLFVQQLFLNDWWTAPQWNLRKKFIFKFKLSLSSNHGSSLEMSECFHSCSLSFAVIVWSNLKGNLDIKRKSANFTLMVSFCLVFVPSVHSQTYAVTSRNHLL